MWLHATADRHAGTRARGQPISKRWPQLNGRGADRSGISSWACKCSVTKTWRTAKSAAWARALGNELTIPSEDSAAADEPEAEAKALNPFTHRISAAFTHFQSPKAIRPGHMECTGRIGL